MAVKVDYEIFHWAANGGVLIGDEPGFDESCLNLERTNPDRTINPASLDLRLSNQVRRLKRYPLQHLSTGATDPFSYIEVKYTDLEASKKVWGDVEFFSKEHPLKLYPHELVLLSSYERTIIPPDWIALLFLKSGGGRRGVEHLHAGLGDCGFDGTWTFEIMNLTNQIVWLIEPFERLVQLVFFETSDVPQNVYGKVGAYQFQNGPTEFRPSKFPVASSKPIL